MHRPFVINIPFAPVRLDKAVTNIKARSIALTQDLKADWKTGAIGFVEKVEQDGAAQPFVLPFGEDVEVFKQQRTLRRAEGEATHKLAIWTDDETGMFGPESAGKPLKGPLPVEAGDALQALAHGGKSQFEQTPEIVMR